MGFRKMMASLGAGAAKVETELTQSDVFPGGVVSGEVRVEGGSVAQQIQGIAIGLQAKVEVDRVDSEGRRTTYLQNMEFHREQLGGEFEIAPGAVFTAPFSVELPWETPVTMFMGRQLTGMNVGVTTELAIARAVDKGDLDPINVHPLPAQEALLNAFGQLGFAFKSADLEKGGRRGVRRQVLPFYQEIEFRVPSQYPGLSEVEVTFVADGREMDVVLDMDKKGLFNQNDTIRSFVMGLDSYEQTDWAAYLHQWLAEVGGKRNWF
jgi:sporulation-control protein